VTDGGRWSSPGTSRPWRRSTPPIRWRFTGSIWAASITALGGASGCPYLYLTDDELRSLFAIEAAGADITAQDLPTTSAVALRSLS